MKRKSTKDVEALEDAADVRWLKKARQRQLHFRSLEEYLADQKRKKS